MHIKHYLLLCLWIVSSAIYAQKQRELVILHTNDTHSRIEPLPSTDPFYPDRGGIINRKSVIDSVRNIHPHLLLLDAGDFVQGTPYYNLFHGRIEIESLNLLGYDAVTLGNHEFDYGLDTLQVILHQLDCPVICCNYDFTGTPLEGMTEPYIIIKRNGIKTGIIGVGIQPDGLIQKNKYEGMKFLPVTETVNQYAAFLKNKKKCDMIICLSHIGHQPDIRLAEESEYIDLIIGGHTHTYLETPVIKKNLQDREVLIYQAGKNGSVIGEINLRFSGKKH